MRTVDGALGEGGGQVLRTCLGLSMVTGLPFRLENIRARRPRPGLGRQHLTAVEAAAALSGARTEGAAPRSRTLTFEPGALRAGDFRFDIGSAGSTTLVVQALLPALLRAPGPVRLTLHGGTHNQSAPPFEFLACVLFPLLRRMGARIDARLGRHGFFPEGGGRLEVEADPTDRLEPLELLDRGRVRRRRAVARVAHLDLSIAERELEVVRRRLGWTRKELVAESIDDADGPGNVLLLQAECDGGGELTTGFGRIRVPAEKVAAGAVREMERWLRARVPVGERLADQLLVPLALAGGGAFRTPAPTLHTETNARIIERFLPVRIETLQEEAGVHRIGIRALDGNEASE